LLQVMLVPQGLVGPGPVGCDKIYTNMNTESVDALFSTHQLFRLGFGVPVAESGAQCLLTAALQRETPQIWGTG
jgi:hypothetical protein